MSAIRRPPGCACLYDGDRLFKRCDQCEEELRELAELARPKRKPRKHAQKIVAAVADHVPVRMTWHVIECRCGWSTALHHDKDEAAAAYDAHVKSDARKKRAA